MVYPPLHPLVINLHHSSLTVVLLCIFPPLCVIHTALIGNERFSPSLSLCLSPVSAAPNSQTHIHTQPHTHPQQMFSPINWIRGFSISINYLLRNRRSQNLSQVKLPDPLKSRELFVCVCVYAYPHFIFHCDETFCVWGNNKSQI